MITDPISDLLCRLQNSSRGGHERMDVPGSRVLAAIADVLKEEGYIRSYKWLEIASDRAHTQVLPQRMLRIYLKFTAKRQPVLTHATRVSRPGRRRYVTADRIPRVLNGMGTAILSTSQGVLSDRRARKARIGGELLCFVH